jgi:hypothetical protein
VKQQFPMPYETIFEISHKPFPWWFPACGLLIIAFGYLIQKGVIPTRASARGGKSWGWPVIIFGVLWTTLAFGFAYSKYARYNKAYRNSQYSVIEGTVEGFQPMPHEGCKCECFRVKDVAFCYSDYDMRMAGFNQSASHGGPIREGLSVRIAYRDDQILRIEISPTPNPSPLTSR